MKKLILFLMTVPAFFPALSQPLSRIMVHTESESPERLSLYQVKDGMVRELASWNNDAPDSFGIEFTAPYEGFYVIGPGDRDYFTPLYLKPGDQAEITFGQYTGRLSGENTVENEVLYRWQEMSDTIAAKTALNIRFQSTYEDFFPQIETLASRAEEFKAGIRTGNEKFDRLMKDFVDYSLVFYGFNMLYRPRQKHPEKEDFNDYMNSIYDPARYTDDRLLAFHFGRSILEYFGNMHRYVDGVHYGPQLAVDKLGDDRLKGEYLISVFEKLEFYNDYKELVDQYSSVFTDEQRVRHERIGAGLYSAREGEPASDFTYPDIDGNMVSLSDFRGKVVLVDVWATWCGPCMAEIPHLKALEKEMEGTDLVVLGVSLDQLKDHGKWKDFVVKEQLGGIQLFADGFDSKIALDYKINGIPRFMLFDRQGNIVDVKCPRPSGPELREMIRTELQRPFNLNK